MLLAASGTAAEYAKWTWSQQLPAEVATQAVRAHRTAEAVDKFFHDDPTHPSSLSALRGF